MLRVFRDQNIFITRIDMSFHHRVTQSNTEYHGVLFF
jgi:hypothetical protein